MKLYMVRNKSGLIPAYDKDRDTYSKIPYDEILEWTTRKVRNPKLNAKFHALIDLGFHNQELYDDRRTFKRDVVISAGFYKEVVTTKGVEKIALDTDFESMDDADFQDLFNKSLDVMCRVLTTESEEIMQQLVDFF